MGNILGLLPFAGCMLIVFCIVSMLVHFRSVASSPLIPVSFNSCTKGAAFLVPKAAIISSISFSNGMNGSVSSGLYVGGVHFICRNSKKFPYEFVILCFVDFLSCMFAIVALTVSGSLRLHCLANCRRLLSRALYVFSARPLFFMCWM